MVLDDLIEPGSNLAVFQILGTLPLEVDFFYTSPGGRATETEAEAMPQKNRLTDLLQRAEAAFDERFEKTFHLQENVSLYLMSFAALCVTLYVVSRP